MRLVLSCLQKDLEMLEKWERDWSMEFNPDKCEIMRISKKSKIQNFPYKLHNIELKSAKHSKYLGVTISEDFSWNKHIANTSAKAFNTLKFIQRNIQTSNKKIKETAYKTYVRPQLEYCNTIWHPWQEKLSHSIERVQRAAARYVMNDYSRHSSVTSMLETLKWQTLEQRRNYSSLIMLFKISHGLVIVDHHHLIPTVRKPYNFVLPQSRTNFHAMSFFPRSIKLWNALPTDLKTTEKLSTFSHGLHAHMF